MTRFYALWPFLAGLLISASPLTALALEGDAAESQGEESQREEAQTQAQQTQAQRGSNADATPTPSDEDRASALLRQAMASYIDSLVEDPPHNFAGQDPGEANPPTSRTAAERNLRARIRRVFPFSDLCGELTGQQMALMTAGDLEGMTPECFAQLEATAVQAIDREAFAGIPPSAFTDLHDRMLPVRNHRRWRRFTPEQMSWISESQWRGLPARNLRRSLRFALRIEWIRQIDLNRLPTSGLRAIRRTHIGRLTDGQLRAMDPNRIFEMTRGQLLSFTPHQLRIIRDVGGEALQERLRSHEDSAFRALNGLEYGVRLIGDSYAQLAGIAEEADGVNPGTSFGLGVDAEEVLWHIRAVIRGGVTPFLLVADPGSADFGQSMLTPESQPLYLGLGARYSLHVGRKLLMGVRGQAHIGQLRWGIRDGNADDPNTTLREAAATTFSFNGGVEIWAPFSMAGNYTDIRLFLGATLHGVGLVGDRGTAGFFGEATTGDSMWNGGVMARVAMRVNRVDVSAAVRWVGGDVPGLSGWSFIPAIGFAPGATMARWCHSVDCMTDDDANETDRSHANLGGQEMHGDYTSVNFQNANLAGANLSGAQLVNADLRGADLSGANLERADLRGARLCGATLAGAELGEGETTVFSGARYDRHTTWPEEFLPSEAVNVSGDADCRQPVLCRRSETAGPFDFSNAEATDGNISWIAFQLEGESPAVPSIEATSATLTATSEYAGGAVTANTSIKITVDGTSHDIVLSDTSSVDTIAAAINSTVENLARNEDGKLQLQGQTRGTDATLSLEGTDPTVLGQLGFDPESASVTGAGSVGNIAEVTVEELVSLLSTARLRQAGLSARISSNRLQVCGADRAIPVSPLSFE